AELGTGLGADLYPGHGKTPGVFCWCVCVVTQLVRASAVLERGGAWARARTPRRSRHRARVSPGGALAVATHPAYPSGGAGFTPSPPTADLVTVCGVSPVSGPRRVHLHLTVDLPGGDGRQGRRRYGQLVAQDLAGEPEGGVVARAAQLAVD